jgi:hypothetical protein
MIVTESIKTNNFKFSEMHIFMLCEVELVLRDLENAEKRQAII